MLEVALSCGLRYRAGDVGEGSDGGRRGGFDDGGKPSKTFGNKKTPLKECVTKYR